MPANQCHDTKMAVRTEGGYRPRRRRSGNPAPFQLTPRDINILRLVARYRFLNSEHIRRLIRGSSKNIGTRTKSLFEHRYLDRPDCQYDQYRPGGGSLPIVYALADRGARLLKDEDGIDGYSRVSWRQKNARVGRPFLEHTLAIADFSVGLRVAVADRNDIELVDGEALLETFPETTRGLPKPYRLSVPLSYQSERHTIGVEPDYAFSLVLPKQRRRAVFLVEIDRGTMPIERSDLKQTSIIRKILAYQALWQAKLHQSRFGCRNFRVLIVATNAERIENMRMVMAGYGQLKGPSLFLLANRQSLYSDDVLAYDWVDGNGRWQRLLPSL